MPLGGEENLSPASTAVERIGALSGNDTFNGVNGEDGCQDREERVPTSRVLAVGRTVWESVQTDLVRSTGVTSYDMSWDMSKKTILESLPLLCISENILG